MDLMSKSHGFLAWRSTEEAEYVTPQQGPFGSGKYCVYCGELLVETFTETAHWEGNLTGLECYFCGWFQWHMSESWCTLYDEEQFRQAILVDLDVDDPSLAESEIRAGLVGDRMRAQLLSPRRFEELVANIYKDLGYEVVLTRSSRDDGRDIILYGKGHEEFAIVEVKRHKERIGVEFVRQLRGVQLREDAPRAILVSAAGFTAGAQAEASHHGPVRRGYTMALTDISDLLSELKLTGEPLINVAAAARDRGPFRTWFTKAFSGIGESRGKANPRIADGGPTTIAAGW
jgi:hypothetical protein